MRTRAVWQRVMLSARDPLARSAWGVRIGGAALLGATLLPWYTVHRLAALGPGRVDAWRAFQHTDLVIAGLALVALLAGCVVSRRVAWPLEAAAGLAALGLCAVSIVHLPAIPPPAIFPHLATYYVRAAGVLAGPFVAAAAALAMVVCAGLTWRARSRPGFARRPSAAWALAAILVAAALVRFATLGQQSYWYDEAATVSVVGQSDLSSAVHQYLGTEATPPLYYALAWGWVHLFGTGEAALRALSALFGTAAVGVTFLAGRRLVGPRAALAAALLLAVNPIMVWYSQEARAYALLVLMSAITLWLFARAREQPTRRNVAWWAAAACLALLTHYYAIFPVGVEGALLLAGPARRWASALPALAVVACGVALIPLVDRQGGGSRTAFIATIPLGDRVEAIGKELVSANTLVIDENTFPPGGHVGTAAIVALLLAVVWSVVVAARRRRLDWQSGGVLVLGIGVAALLIPLALSQVGRDYILDRNVLPAWLPLALAAGAAIVLLPRAVMAAVLAVVVVAGTLTNLKVTDRLELQRADWRDAVRATGAPRGGRVTIVTPSFDRGTVGIYRPDAQLLGAGAIRASEIDVIGQFNVYASKAIPPGFRLIYRGQIQQVSFLRLQVLHPTVINAASLRANGTDPLAVLVEYTPAARRWTAAYFGELGAWQQAVQGGASAAPARRELMARAPGDAAVLARPAPDIAGGAVLGPRAAAAALAGAAWAAAALRAVPGRPDPGLLRVAARFDRLRSHVYAAARIGLRPPSAADASRRLTTGGP